MARPRPPRAHGFVAVPALRWKSLPRRGRPCQVVRCFAKAGFDCKTPTGAPRVHEQSRLFATCSASPSAVASPAAAARCSALTCSKPSEGRNLGHVFARWGSGLLLPLFNHLASQELPQVRVGGPFGCKQMEAWRPPASTKDIKSLVQGTASNRLHPRSKP